MLDDLALTVADNEDEIALITEQLDAVDEDLDALESYVYDDESDCDICDDFEDDLYERVPVCKEIVCFDSSIFDGDEQLTCPIAERFLTSSKSSTRTTRRRTKIIFEIQAGQGRLCFNEKGSGMKVFVLFPRQTKTDIQKAA